MSWRPRAEGSPLRPRPAGRSARRTSSRVGSTAWRTRVRKPASWFGSSGSQVETRAM